MNCPKCAHELPENADRCPDCGASLLELVTLGTGVDPMLFPVLHSLLESEGIACLMTNEGAQDAVGISTPARLQVALKDAEAARELIAHHIAALDVDAAEAETESSQA